MRRPLIAGNWKMNLNRADAVALSSDLVNADKSSEVDVLICPSHIYLDAVSSTLGDSGISLGAQDVYFEAGGAFTGEISTGMLSDVGCQFVILGHSERLHVMGKTESSIIKKVIAVLDVWLTPVLCVEETL